MVISHLRKCSKVQITGRFINTSHLQCCYNVRVFFFLQKYVHSAVCNDAYGQIPNVVGEEFRSQVFPNRGWRIDIFLVSESAGSDVITHL